MPLALPRRLYRSTSGTTRCWWRRRTSAGPCWKLCTRLRWGRAQPRRALARSAAGSGRGRVAWRACRPRFSIHGQTLACLAAFPLLCAVQNDKRQLETAMVVEGTQAAAIKRTTSSGARTRQPSACMLRGLCWRPPAACAHSRRLLVLIAPQSCLFMPAHASCCVLCRRV